MGKKGVVRDPEVHRQVLDGFLELARQLELSVLGLTFSPVKGPEGNIEFLAHLTRVRGNRSVRIRPPLWPPPIARWEVNLLKKIILTPNPYRDKSFKFVLTAQNYLAASGAEIKICLPFDVDKGLICPEA